MAGLVINTNLGSLLAQRNLGNSVDNLQRSIERLSSGMRINKASDDAAGLAISEGLRAKIRGYGQALRNVNDGVSMVQVGEGSLNEVTNILIRMRELAVQSSNSTLGSSERNTLHDEYQALKNEIARIASVTEFVGLKLLDSTTAAGIQLQVGINDGSDNRITVSGVDARTITIGSTSATGEYDYYTGSVIGGAATVLVYQGGSMVGSFATAAADIISVVTSAVTATITGGTATGTDVITATGADATTRVSNVGGTFNNVYTGAVTVSIVPSSTLSTIQFAESSIAITQRIEDTYISVQGSAQTAISSVDSAISYITSKRGAFGSAQNRLLSTIANLQVSIENVTAANSQIRDADFAMETAVFTKYQILQQAGVSILAQANTVPQTALSLLR